MTELLLPPYYLEHDTPAGRRFAYPRPKDGRTVWTSEAGNR